MCELLPSLSQAPHLPAPTAAADLPHAVLLLILQHLPARQRLGSAALVSTSWQAAAADATTSIQKDITHSLSQASLRALMARVCHMQCSPSAVQSCTPGPITSLHLTGPTSAEHDPSALLPLTEPLVAPSAPLPALRELRVSGLVLQLGPKAVTPQGSSSSSSADSNSGNSSGGGSSSSAIRRVHPGWVQQAPNLTRLELDGCELGPGMHSLAALTSLTSLRHLLLGVGEMDQQPPGRDFPPVADPSLEPASGAVPALTPLHLSATDAQSAPEPAPEPAVEEHTVCGGRPQPPQTVTFHGMWAHLTGLTHLDLSGSYAFPGAEDHPWLPALSCLTQLRELRLCMVWGRDVHGLTPLLPLKHLSSLLLAGWCGPCAPDEDYEPTLLLDSNPASGASTCATGSNGHVHVLARLPSLVQLELYCVHDVRPWLLAQLTGLKHLNLSQAGRGDPPAVDCVAALARLTGLTHLELYWLAEEEEEDSDSEATEAAQAAGATEAEEAQEAAEAAEAAAAAAAAAEEAEAAAAEPNAAGLGPASCLHPPVASAGTPRAAPAPAAWLAAFNTLAAGALQLHILILAECRFPFDTSLLLPALPSLRELHICTPATRTDTSSLRRIVDHCPALSRLVLRGALKPGVDLSPLLQLTGLRDLNMAEQTSGSVPGAYSAAARGLAGVGLQLQTLCEVLPRLTGLVRLTHETPYAEPGQLLQLSGLSWLTELQVYCLPGPGQQQPLRQQQQQHVGGPLGYPVRLLNQAPNRLMPDVASQLVHYVATQLGAE